MQLSLSPRADLPIAIEKELAISVANLVSKIPATDPDYDMKLTAKTGQYSGRATTSTEEPVPASPVSFCKKGAHLAWLLGTSSVQKPKITDGTGLSGVASLKTKFNPRLTAGDLRADGENNESTPRGRGWSLFRLDRDLQSWAHRCGPHGLVSHG